MDRSAEAGPLLGRGWLAAQPAPFRAALLRRGTRAGFARGEAVFHVDDAPGGIYGVVSGSFGVYAATRDAGPTLGHVMHPGGWFGHGPVFTRSPRVLSFRALEPSVALHVPLAVLSDVVGADPAAALCLGALANANVDAAVAAVADLLIRRADRRVAAVLLRAAGAHPGGGAPATTDLALSQADLGDMANVSRHLANRTLANFEAQGWVARRYGGILLLDPEALHMFASGVA